MLMVLSLLQSDGLRARAVVAFGMAGALVEGSGRSRWC